MKAIKRTKTVNKRNNADYILSGLLRSDCERSKLKASFDVGRDPFLF